MLRTRNYLKELKILVISFSREVFPPIGLKVKGANMGEMKKFLDKTVKRRYLLRVPFFLLVDRSWQVIL